VAEELCSKTKSELIHSIGGVILVLRRNPLPDPRLSNLIRRV
jgi:RNA-binding protein